MLVDGVAVAFDDKLAAALNGDVVGAEGEAGVVAGFL
jgi:hypothetical protein